MWPCISRLVKNFSFRSSLWKPNAGSFRKIISRRGSDDKCPWKRMAFKNGRLWFRRKLETPRDEKYFSRQETGKNCVSSRSDVSALGQAGNAGAYLMHRQTVVLKDIYFTNSPVKVMTFQNSSKQNERRWWRNATCFARSMTGLIGPLTRKEREKGREERGLAENSDCEFISGRK